MHTVHGLATPKKNNSIRVFINELVIVKYYRPIICLTTPNYFILLIVCWYQDITISVFIMY